MPTQRHDPQLRERIQQCPPQVILKAADLCDGHTIFVPKLFVDAGLPVEIVEAATHTYQSDGSPKGSIFVGDKTVPELRGVYGLDLLRFLARALGVSYLCAFGRGTEARNIQMALRQHFQPKENAPDSLDAIQQ